MLAASPSLFWLPVIPWAELVARYRAGLAEVTPWAIGAGVFVALVSLPLLLPRPVAPRALRVVLLAAVVAFGVTWGFHLLWLGDDAFISFRYAENFAHGHGLVFNVGERVEGYTNFLWTFIIGVGMRLGLSPIHVSVALTLASFAAVILQVDHLAKKLAPWRAPVTVSFAAGLTAANYVMANFATSGLETMFGAALMLAALISALHQRPLAAGVFGILATMTHPDHAIFYASLAVALLFDRARWRGILWYAAPFVFLFVPYFAWRWHYYGDFFPNTYYTKSGGSLYFEQGWVYVAVTVFGAGLFAAIPMAAFGVVRRFRHFLSRYFLLSTLLYTLYVAKIGGDFMLGRLFVPVLPLLFLFAELGARELFAARRRWLAPAGLVAILPVFLAALPVHVIKPIEKKWHIADERSFYLVGKEGDLVPRSLYVQWARDLLTYVVSHDVHPLVAFGSCGMVAYYTKLPLVDIFGLADKTVARKPIERRGRPGHEKIASPGYIVSRGVRISELSIYPEPYSRISEVVIEGNKFYFPVFDNHLADSLRAAPAPFFTDARGWIDRYKAPSDFLEGMSCGAWFMEEYYFSHNADPARLRQTRDKIVRANPALRGLEHLLVKPEQGAGFSRVRALHLDDPKEGWHADGEAFAEWPSPERIAVQDLVIHHDGPFANSMVPHAGDVGTGRLTSRPFVLTGDAITFVIGGGRNRETLRVSLVVDGQRVRDATGCMSEIMGHRVWRTSELRGKTAHIEIVDEANGGWGHVMADEIEEWKLSRPASP